MLSLEFEPDFGRKVLWITFSSPTVMHQKEQWQDLKSRWCQELKLWHTPYKVLLDMSLVTFGSNHQDQLKSLQRTLQFFKGFHLKKAVIYGLPYDQDLPCANFMQKQAAMDYLGLRSSQSSLPSNQEDHRKLFRSSLVIYNHLQENTVELVLSQQTPLLTDWHVELIRSKLTNNLMQLHGSWWLLIDVSLVDQLSDSSLKPLRRMIRFFQGFFMVGAVAYGKVFNSSFDEKLRFFKTKHRALNDLKKKQNTFESETENISDPENSCLSRPSG